MIRAFFGFLGLAILGYAMWFVGNKISADALGMAIGFLFGILGSVPIILLFMANNRQSEKKDENYKNLGNGQMNPYPNQSPILILTGGNVQPMQQQNQVGNYLDSVPSGFAQNQNMRYNDKQIIDAEYKPTERKFKVIGEEGENAW